MNSLVSANLKNFDCGNQIINNYVTKGNLKKVLNDNRGIVARAFFDDSHNLKGFVTFNVHSVQKKDFTEVDAPLPLRSIPTLRVIMLGVDKNYQGNGLGSDLLNLIFDTAIKLKESAGVVGVYLDATKEAVPFYRGLGFEIIGEQSESNTVPMFIDVRDIDE